MSVRSEHGPERVDGELTLWGAFAQHRRDAKKRKIPFLLNFEEWLAIWTISGQLDNRGCKIGQYVMARFGDTGPYSATNVKIITVAENHHEANIGSKRPKSPEHRLKMSALMKGRPSWNKGIPMAELTKEKLRKPKSEVTKSKLRTSWLERAAVGKVNATLTRAQVRYIRSKAGKKTGADIGRQLGIHAYIVNGVLRGDTYAWLK